jgi:hypothetical protein
MAMSDTAEDWFYSKMPRMPYMGRHFVHIPKSTCGHINPITGNTDVSEYLNDVDCFACLKLIEENGNIYNLKEGISKREQSAIDKDKHRFRHGKCDCGSPMQIRINKSNNKNFLGCLQYPKCKKTKSITQITETE